MPFIRVLKDRMPFIISFFSNIYLTNPFADPRVPFGSLDMPFHALSLPLHSLSLVSPPSPSPSQQTGLQQLQMTQQLQGDNLNYSEYVPVRMKTHCDGVEYHHKEDTVDLYHLIFFFESYVSRVASSIFFVESYVNRVVSSIFFVESCVIIFY